MAPINRPIYILHMADFCAYFVGFDGVPHWPYSFPMGPSPFRGILGDVREAGCKLFPASPPWTRLSSTHATASERPSGNMSRRIAATRVTDGRRGESPENRRSAHNLRTGACDAHNPLGHLADGEDIQGGRHPREPPYNDVIAPSLQLPRHLLIPIVGSAVWEIFRLFNR